MAKSSKLRCAVIGLGMGKAHVRGYQETEEAELVAVADLDTERLGAYKDAVGEDGLFTDYRKMLKQAKPDLVSVALPNKLHAPVTIAALRAGAHVLCEKPMAMTVSESRRMQAEAEKAGRKLGINLSFRATPQARALKDMADAGFLGKPYHASTRWTRRFGMPGFGGWFGQKALSGGGPLIDLGVHRIDLAMWLMGGARPVTVSGMTHHHIGVPLAKSQGKAFDVEDFAAGFVRFDNDVSLVFEVSWAGHQETKEFMHTMVVGTRGTLVHRNDEQGAYNFLGEFHTDQHGHKLSGRVAQANPEVRSNYGEMVRAVVNDTRPLADAEDGIAVQQILDGLYRSARTGREVRVR